MWGRCLAVGDLRGHLAGNLRVAIGSRPQARPHGAQSRRPVIQAACSAGACRNGGGDAGGGQRAAGTAAGRWQAHLHSLDEAGHALEGVLPVPELHVDLGALFEDRDDLGAHAAHAPPYGAAAQRRWLRRAAIASPPSLHRSIDLGARSAARRARASRRAPKTTGAILRRSAGADAGAASQVSGADVRGEPRPGADVAGARHGVPVL